MDGPILKIRHRIVCNKPEIVAKAIFLCLFFFAQMWQLVPHEPVENISYHEYVVKDGG
jgi:hypothetical protein